jgi:RND superfamily putative drug exporter
VSPLVRARDGHTAFAKVQFDAITTKLPATDIQAVINEAESYAARDLQVALGGPPITAVVSPSPGSSEGIGITAAIIIMLVAGQVGADRTRPTSGPPAPGPMRSSLHRTPCLL